MSRPLTNWQIVSKGLSVLEMTDRERRMLSFLIENGSRMEWRSAQANFYETLAFYMGWNRTSATRAVQSLIQRGWVEEWHDNKLIHHVMISKAYIADAKRALKHKDARTALGIRAWFWLEPSESEVDALIARAEMLTDGTLIKRIKHVWDEMAGEYRQCECRSVTVLLKRLPPIDNSYINAMHREQLADADDEA